MESYAFPTDALSQGVGGDWDAVSPQRRELCPETADLPIAPSLAGWTPRFRGNLSEYSDVSASLPTTGATFSKTFTSDMSRQNSPNEFLFESMQSLKDRTKFYPLDVSQDVPYFAYPPEVPHTGPDQVSSPEKRGVSCGVTGCKSSFVRKRDLDRHERMCHRTMYYCPDTSCQRSRIGFYRADKLFVHQRLRHPVQCGDEEGSSLGTIVTGGGVSSSCGKLQEQLKIPKELSTEIENDIRAPTRVLSLIEEGSSLETTASGAVTNLTGEDKICFEQFQLSSTDNDCLKFGTGSSCWEEETDETESTIDDGEGSGTFDTLADISTTYHDEHSLALMKPVLTYAKQRLVDRIMKEFWIIFNQGWVGNVRKRTGSVSVSGRESSSSSDPNSPDQNQGSQKSQKSGKRRRDDEPNDDPDDRDQEPERPKEGSKDLYRRKLKFACPYRKHNPRKYCVQSIWRSCALTPQDTVARVKGHLYRHHRIFQCQRCKTLFDTSEEVDEHLQASKGCDLILAREAEGITANIEKRLRSRKKTSKDQTEEERWVEMYRLIFPGDLVPSPYFEPILEDVDQPRETELFLYEEYSRQELPRMFRDAIETLVSEGTQPLENQLRGQLTTIIQECQDRIFSNYLRQKPRPSPSSAVIGEQTILGTIIAAPGHEGITSNELANFFQRPPPPQMDVVGLSISTASSSSHRYNSSTGMGYLSDISTLPSSQDFHECTSVHHSIDSSGAASSEFAAPLPVIPYTHNHLSDYAPFQDGGEDLALVSSDNLLGMSPSEGNFNLDFDREC